MQLLIVAALTQFAIGAPLPSRDFDFHDFIHGNLIKSVIHAPGNSCSNRVTTIGIIGKYFRDNCSNISVETGTDDHSNSDNRSGSYPDTSNNTSDYPSATPETDDSLSTTPEADDSSSTTPNTEDSSSTTPNTENSSSTTPEAEDSSSTTPNTEDSSNTDTDTDDSTDTTTYPDNSTDTTAHPDDGDDEYIAGKLISTPIHYPINKCNNNVRYVGDVPIYDYSCINISVQTGTDDHSNQ